MKRQGYILLLAALLTGCNSEVALPARQISSPVPTVEMVSILPTPFVFDSEDLKTTVATGAVTGVLLLQTETGVQPVTDMKMALGEALVDDKGAEHFVSYDSHLAPVSYTDSNGRFVFEEIKPGRYGLVLDLVVNQYLLHEADSSYTLLFEVVAGEVIDLGRLEYADLPLPE